MSEERDIIEARWELSRRHPLWFFHWFVYTLDTHSDTPIRPFPDHLPHIRALTRLWLGNRMLFIAKSRQMLVTWFAAAISAWYAVHRPGRLVYQQSKRLEDVVGNEHTGDGLMGRTKFILNHIPYRDWLLPKGTVDIKSESITFPRWNSSITPLAQGGDKIRSHTVSLLVTDETAFQDQFADAFTATVASIRRGRWLGITTPDLHDGGTSMRIAMDLPDLE